MVDEFIKITAPAAEVIETEQIHDFTVTDDVVFFTPSKDGLLRIDCQSPSSHC